jgi:hypothetical protein
MVHRSTFISLVVWVTFNTTSLSCATIGYSKRHYLIRLLGNWRAIKVQQFNEGQHGPLSSLLICPKVARNSFFQGQREYYFFTIYLKNSYSFMIYELYIVKIFLIMNLKTYYQCLNKIISLESPNKYLFVSLKFGLC